MTDKACYDLEEKSRRELGQESSGMKNFCWTADGQRRRVAHFQGRHQSISRYLQFRRGKLGIEFETIRGGRGMFSSDLVLARDRADSD